MMIYPCIRPGELGWARILAHSLTHRAKHAHEGAQHQRLSRGVLAVVPRLDDSEQLLELRQGIVIE